MARIPVEIVNAINAMLLPYGEKFAPAEGREERACRGYLNWKGAVAYTGLSKSTLQRAVKAGALKAPHKMASSKNATALFEIAELDRFIRAH